MFFPHISYDTGLNKRFIFFNVVLIILNYYITEKCYERNENNGCSIYLNNDITKKETPGVLNCPMFWAVQKHSVARRARTAS